MSKKKLTVEFKPKQVIIDATIVVKDRDEIVDEWDKTFAYKWDRLDKIIKLLPQFSTYL